jgi:Ca-activated chloride channel family protein
MIALLILIDLWGWLLAGELGSKTRSGNAAYRQKSYEEALKRYTDAQLEAPEEPRLHFNLGAALYRQRQFGKAAEEFQKAADVDQAAVASDAYYNLGNARFRQQDLAAAIESYTKALELRPSHRDAKHNLELARKLLKQNAQPQPQNQPDQPQPGQPQDGQGQDQPQPSEPEKQPAGAPDQPAEQERGEAQAAEAREPGKMTQEEAQAMLDALQERERANSRRPVRAPRDDVAKDW